MFSETYPAVYQDRFGEVATTIHNDGKALRMTLRGVEFIGHHLDDWEPDAHTDAAQVQQFTLFPTYRWLCDYTLAFEMPVPVIVQTERLQGLLHVHFVLGPPRRRERGFVNGEGEFLLRLDVAGSSFSARRSDDFESVLLALAKQFPAGMYLQTCLFCAFSDYSPAGKQIFGDLACFRGNKQHYLAVRSKFDLFAIWKTRTEEVQETYHCSEFEPRQPGTGYRG